LCPTGPRRDAPPLTKHAHAVFPCSDFDGDGYADVAAVGLDLGFQVLLNTGSGAFYPSGFSPLLPGAQDLVARDFNGDGKADLAVLTRTDMLIYLGKGDGTFWT
jgi:hypothetical protein